MIALLIVIFGSLLIVKYNLFEQYITNNQQVKKTQVQINGTTLNVEIADTSSKRQQGLGGRDSLSEDSGMLFVFEDESVRTFWMKGMKIPLDIIWIRNGKVVDITKNVQPASPGLADDQIPLITVSQSVDKVLEVNANFSDKRQISIGQSVQIVEK